MNVPVKLAPEQAAFIAAVDRHAKSCGLPTYTEIAEALFRQVRALERAEGIGATLHGALVASADHAAMAEGFLHRTGSGVEPAVLEALLDGALESAATARETANRAIFEAETRPDLEALAGIAVLARHRDRLRAAGRRA